MTSRKGRSLRDIESRLARELDKPRKKKKAPLKAPQRYEYEYDEDSGAWYIFKENFNHATESYSSEIEAKYRVAELNKMVASRDFRKAPRKTAAKRNGVHYRTRRDDNRKDYLYIQMIGNPKRWFIESLNHKKVISPEFSIKANAVRWAQNYTRKFGGNLYEWNGLEHEPYKPASRDFRKAPRKTAAKRAGARKRRS